MKNLSIVCLLLLMCTIGCKKTETGLNASTDTTTLVENVNALAFDQDIECFFFENGCFNNQNGI